MNIEKLKKIDKVNSQIIIIVSSLILLSLLLGKTVIKELFYSTLFIDLFYCLIFIFIATLIVETVLSFMIRDNERHNNSFGK